MERRNFIISTIIGILFPYKRLKSSESKDCPHTQVRCLPYNDIGTCTCMLCGKTMKLYEGFNCLLDAMRRELGIKPIIKNEK